MFFLVNLASWLQYTGKVTNLLTYLHTCLIRVTFLSLHC